MAIIDMYDCVYVKRVWLKVVHSKGIDLCYVKVTVYDCN